MPSSSGVPRPRFPPPTFSPDGGSPSCTSRIPRLRRPGAVRPASPSNAMHRPSLLGARVSAGACIMASANMSWTAGNRCRRTGPPNYRPHRPGGRPRCAGPRVLGREPDWTRARPTRASSPLACLNWATGAAGALSWLARGLRRDEIARLVDGLVDLLDWGPPSSRRARCRAGRSRPAGPRAGREQSRTARNDAPSRKRIARPEALPSSSFATTGELEVRACLPVPIGRPQTETRRYARGTGQKASSAPS